MCARLALLVVLLLSVGRLARQQSVLDDDDALPANSAGKAATSSVDISTLHTEMNPVKRHIGKFVRIGRSSAGDDWTLRWSPEYSPVVRRRRRSKPYDAVDVTQHTDRSRLVLGGLRRRDTEARPSAVDEVRLQWKRNGRGGGVRFVRIGKSDGQRWKSSRRRSDSVNMYRRSLENRFVRIGK